MDRPRTPLIPALAALSTALIAVPLAVAPTPAQAVAGEPELGATYAFTARLDIGNGQRACSGSLVESQWVLTAASCFTDKPGGDFAVPAGKPKLATKATIGRTDLTTSSGQVRDIVELVPHTGRDLVLAKLSQPVTNITPVALTTTAPTSGEKLQIAGFGRTKDEWVPTKLHTGSLNVASADNGTVGLTSENPSDGSVCKGDAGGPTLRKNGGRLELAAVHSATNEGGCFGSDDAQSKTAETRLDDIHAWVQASVARWSLKAAANNKYVTAEFNETGNQRGKLRARSDATGLWEQFTLHTNGTDTVSLRSVNEKLYVSVEVDDGGTHEGMLRARSATAGGWERLQLKLVPQTGGSYGLKSMQNGKYVTTEAKDPGADNGLLRARADKIGDWERFTFHRADNFPIMNPDSTVPTPVPTASVPSNR
ncbi:trypsin-like serine protease [Streptomyces pinistramenti]|uniref:trypsin-like serine protease n=1 Tax=Streptomyces pinistramenti TaxID=2884812 RepID=UPI001D05F1F2|nr:trypsin-like serine protease [Streptomyces pinistramenti]MCB5910919.1 trypsin-like serine protease [Streptomyces pinistramenti]